MSDNGHYVPSTHQLIGLESEFSSPRVRVFEFLSFRVPRDRVFESSGSSSRVLSLRFGIVLGSVLVPFGGPKWRPRGDTKMGVAPPLGNPERSWDRRGWVLSSSCGLGSLSWSFWAPLGVVLGRSWLLLGPSWLSWARFGVLRGTFSSLQFDVAAVISTHTHTRITCTHFS